MGKQRLRSASRLISAYNFATQIVHSLFFVNPKSQASSPLLSLDRLVYVQPVQNPELLVLSGEDSFSNAIVDPADTVKLVASVFVCLN